jgi:hypothetical protein
MEQFTEQYLWEFMKCAMKNPKVMAIAIAHLKYEFLPNESYKKIWKSVSNQYRIAGNKLPSFGLIYEDNKFDKDAISGITKIEKAEVLLEDAILNKFDDFIRQSKFVQLHNTLSDLWGDSRHQDAIKKLMDGAEEISKFSIRPQIYSRIYTGFDERQTERKRKRLAGEDDNMFIPTLIDEVDAAIGGIKRKQTFLLQAQSGYGKSTFLRWLAVAASLMGYKVLLVSAEDSQEDVELMVDVTWTKQTTDAFGSDLPEELLEKIHKSAKKIVGDGGEIFVRCFEQFGSANMAAVMAAIDDVNKIDDKPIDFVVIDYLEKFEPIRAYPKGDQRAKRLAVAEEMKNGALTTNSAWATATQGSTVDPNQLNDPTFVQTRYNIAEMKALVDPFSYFATLNITKDERDQGLCRLHFDKLRYYQAGKTFMIYQNLNKGQFYLPNKTKRLLLNKDSTDESPEPKSRIIKKKKLGERPKRN